MMRILILLIVFFEASVVASAARPYVVVLGVGQDAGVPQMSCDTPFCRSAWKTSSLRQMVSSIALVDPDSGKRWIFDATPDLPEQFELLRNITGDRSPSLTGIFLSHAHIGHYTGIMYLGRESMNSKNIPVYAMPRMTRMITQNAPWSQLVDLKNIELYHLADGEAVRLTKDLAITPFLVPHRDEFSETVGFRIESNDRTLLFIPDIDKWEKWDRPLADVLKTVDIALLDGTFFADGEIARPMSEVPHPFVTETIEMLRDLPLKERRKVYFIHFNHSNPIVQGKRDAVNRVRVSGMGVAQTRLKFEL